MKYSRNGLGPNPAKLTKAATRALRLLRGGGELVAQGAGVFTVDREFDKSRTIEPLVQAGLVSPPPDLFQTDGNAGRITDIGLVELDWRDKGAGS